MLLCIVQTSKIWNLFGETHGNHIHLQISDINNQKCAPCYHGNMEFPIYLEANAICDKKFQITPPSSIESCLSTQKLGFKATNLYIFGLVECLSTGIFGSEMGLRLALDSKESSKI
jgi:hypothetical protein